MSVKSVLVKWLSAFPEMEINERVCSEIVDGNESYGVAKEPTQNIQKFIDGSEIVTEYYSFIVKRMVSNDKMRKRNDDLVESLEEWIKEQELPDLGDKKHCDSISIESGGALLSVSDRYGTYSITIEIQYRKDR